MSNQRGHRGAAISRAALALTASAILTLGCQSSIGPGDVATTAPLVAVPVPAVVGAVVWTKAPLLEPRFDHVMATLGTKVVLFGGDLNGPLDDTWEWDGSAWTLKSAFARPSPRYQTAMATLGDKVVLFGGYDAAAEKGLADTWAWDGKTWTHLSPPVSPPGRFGHSMATLSGKVVLFGGCPNPFAVLECHQDTWEWDGATWAQRTPPTAPPIRRAAAMATAGNQIVLFGGVMGGWDYGDTWIWDGSTWSERHPTTAPAARSEAAITSVGGKALLYGGGSKSGNDGDLWAWDGAGWTSLSSSKSLGTRAGAAMATLGSKVVLFGGIEGQYFNDTWEWDGTAWSLRLAGMTPPARGSFAMATLPDRILVFGGYDSGPSNDTWEWEGTGWRQRTPPVRPPKRSDHTMAMSGTDVIMFGGYGDAHLADGRTTYFFNDTWRWDGDTWTDLNPASHPSRRRDHEMASDGQGGIILFGGTPDGTEPDASGVRALGDMWRWDGKTWTQLYPATNPPARYGQAMVLLDGKVIMFGGFNGQSSLDDTWAWDGVDWTRRAALQSPPPRENAAVAAVGHALVLHGGYFPGTGSVDNIGFRDTWTWDGSDWLNLNAAPSPKAFSEARLSYFQGKLLLLAFSGTWFGTIGRQGGAACATSAECATGFCADGVCCDSMCGGASMTDCQACSIAAGAARDGTCGPLADGLGCSDRNPCSVGDRCVAGSCTPSAALTCPSTDVCHATGPCTAVDGLCVSAPVADGTICGANRACQAGQCLDTGAAAGGHAGTARAGGGGGVDAGLDTGGPGSTGKDLASRGCACAVRDTDQQGAGLAMAAVLTSLVLARRRKRGL